MKKAATETVTPFDWKRYTARDAGGAAADSPRKGSAARARKLTVQERVERIMAARWGNPYCKPGAAY
jgi:hypothetical protein